jgi:hypothetical protein
MNFKNSVQTQYYIENKGNEPSALASDKEILLLVFEIREELFLSHAKACGLYIPTIS